jgi:hypothetical protein
MLSFHVTSRRWKAMNDDWFLQSGGVERVPVGNSAVFPMRVTSRLPIKRSGETIEQEIEDPG